MVDNMKKLSELKCNICNKTFYVVKSLLDKRKTCSMKCRSKYLSKVVMKKMVSWKCQVCGKIKLLSVCIAKNKIACSYKCNGKLMSKRMIGNKINEGRTPWNKGITGYCTSWKGKKQSLKAKLNMRKNHFSKTNPSLHKKNYFNSGINKSTIYEKKFAKKLKKYNISFKQQAVVNNEFQVDFLLCNKKIIVEIDGGWHYKDGKLRVGDIKRGNRLKNLGYNIIHIRNEEVEKYGEKEVRGICVL